MVACDTPSLQHTHYTYCNQLPTCRAVLLSQSPPAPSHAVSLSAHHTLHPGKKKKPYYGKTLLPCTRYGEQARAQAMCVTNMSTYLNMQHKSQLRTCSDPYTHRHIHSYTTAAAARVHAAYTHPNQRSGHTHQRLPYFVHMFAG